MKKQIKFKLLGMDTDSDVSIANGISSVNNYNVRFTVTEEGQADAAISNERGTKVISQIALPGIPIGYYALHDFVVFFVTEASRSSDKRDIIFIYKYVEDLGTHEGTFKCIHLYTGNFGFNVKNPIECQGVWEREDLLKVFWVDGKNPLRFITIPKEERTSVNEVVLSDHFDAVKRINLENLESSIDVSKQTFGGTFPVGTIQYAFTYYTKYGAESNIFKVTPLFFISNSGSGAPSDRSMSCSFQIKISNVDKSGEWDYLRVYSILRTAVNGEPVCKRVIDLDIGNFESGNSITYVDNGEFGETIDSTRLLYVGGERIVPKTIAQKDGTLFLGNYKIIRSEITKKAKEAIKKAVENKKDSFFNTYYTNTKDLKNYARKIVSVFDTESALDSTYQYTPQLSDSQNKITTFKSRETYRIGIQLQDETGRWSEPIFLFDAFNNAVPDTVSQLPVDPESRASDGTSATINDTNVVQKPIQFQHWANKDLTIDDGRLTISKEPDTRPSISSSGGSSDNNTVSSRAVDSPVKALLPFGFINMRLKDESYENTNILDYLKSLGYTRIRPIIVYPNEGNREVLFQGVANPTIKKTSAGGELDYRIPSWFFRPIESANSSTTSGSSHYGYLNKYNIGPTFKGVYPVYEDGMRIPYYRYDKLYKNSQAEFQYETTDEFWIDWSVLTIDSPDIRFNEQLSLSDLEGVKARVVGLVDLAGNAASYSIDVDGSTEIPETFIREGVTSTFGDTIPMGNKLKVPFQNISGNIKSSNYGACLINYPFWIDSFSDRGQEGYDTYFAQWYVFPWHRKGSLNNCSSTNMNNIEGAPRPSMLKKKTLANERFGYNTVYGMTSIDNLEVNHARVFIQSSENQIDRFPDGTLFRNSIDVVLPASGLPAFRAIGSSSPESVIITGSLPFLYKTGDNYTEDSYSFKDSSSLPVDNKNIMGQFFRMYSYGDEEMRYYDPHHDGLGNDNQYHEGNDPIPMQFKTGSNCIIQLSSPLDYSSLKFTYSDPDSYKYFREVASGHWLPIIELYRDVQNKFGGDSEDALQQNAWLVAGKPVSLNDDIDLFWDYGDTYFQRYDCLKTMPYSESSVNNIIEILSFFCETRINIDGRYDTNRGLQDNTAITDNNFNQLNKVYTQPDNYFQYYTSDADLVKLNSYNNQIVWSLTRKSGDLVDQWTNITLLNYLDLDGDMGQVRAIKNFNGQLYAFQDKGIASINYNQNVMLSSKDGVPIEIANSEKVTGSTYLSTTKGCINKWAMVDVGQGLVFLDQLNKQFNMFDGKQVINLGENAKFQSWIRKNCDSLDQWNPIWKDIKANTVTLLHDKEANEILLTSKDFSVAYNLGLMRFTSFYSYNSVPWLIKSNSVQFMLNKGHSQELWNAWGIRKGDYNYFFNKFMPYHIEFVASDSKYFDYLKVFTDLEIRDTVTASKKDTYEGNYDNYSLQDSFSFDHIRVTDSYQDSGTRELEFKRGVPSDLKAKFRTWRINVPRNANRGFGRIKDRIRDHYMTVRLSHLNPDSNPVKIHDIIASYMI